MIATAVMAGLFVLVGIGACLMSGTGNVAGISMPSPFNPEKGYIRDYLDRHCDDEYKIKSWTRERSRSGYSVHVVTTREIVDSRRGNHRRNKTRSFMFRNGKFHMVVDGPYWHIFDN